MKNIKKARQYAGLIILLESEKMISINLSYEYMKNIMKDCGINQDEMNDCMDYAKENVDLGSSCIYVGWE